MDDLVEELTYREALAEISFELGVGYGELDLSGRQYKERIDYGIGQLTQPIIDRNHALADEVATLQKDLEWFKAANHQLVEEAHKAEAQIAQMKEDRQQACEYIALEL